MGQVSITDLQDVLGDSTTSTVPQNVSVDDVNRMGLSSDVKYTPKPPQEPNVFDRLTQDVEKPFAQMPQVLGNGMYWLGDTLASDHSPTSIRKLGDRMAAAGIVMKERNQKYMEENFSGFKPNIGDDIVSGVPAVIAGGALAALIGVQAAAGTLAVGVGGIAAGQGYSTLREKGKTKAQADILAGALGAGTGTAMYFGVSKFLSGTGPWFKRALGAVVNNFVGGATVTGVSGSLELATGVKDFNGIESLKELLVQTAHDGIVWGVLGGATAIPLALKQHSALVDGFKQAGLVEGKAREAANNIMHSGADAAMAWVEKELKMTPDELGRIEIPKLEGKQSSGKNDLLDFDFVPKDIREAAPETSKLEQEVSRLQSIKTEMTDLREALKGNISDQRVQKILKKQTQEAEDTVNTKFDKLEAEQEKQFSSEQKDLLKQRKDLEPEQFAKKKSDLVAKQEHLREKLGLQREAELQIEMENRPFIQDVKKELGRLQTQHDALSEKLEGMKKEIKGPSKLEVAKKQLQKLKQGFRQGRVHTKEEIKDVQGSVIDLLKGSELDLKDKGRFLSTVRNVQTAEQLKEKLPEIEARVRHIQETNQEKVWGKDLENVKKKVLPTLPIEYQDALGPVLESFDFAHRSKGKLLARAATLEFFKNKLTQNDTPLSEGEQRALDDASKKSLSEMDHDEIRNLYETIMKVVTEGKRKNEYLTNLDKRNHEARVAQFLKDIDSDEFKVELDNFDKNSVQKNRSLKQRFSDMVKRLDDGLTMPEFMLKWSRLSDVFESLHDAYQNSIEYKQQYFKDLDRIHNNVDVGKAMGKPIEIPELDLVGDKAPRLTDLMRLYAQSFDEGGYRHLANTMTEKKLNDLLNWFEKNHPEEVKAIEKQFDEFSNKIYGQVDEVIQNMEGHHLQKVEFYDPIGASLEDRSGEEMQREMRLSDKGMRDRSLPFSGFTKARVESKLAFRKFDYYGNLVRHLIDVGHYRAMAEALRDANKILYDTRVTAALREKFGPDWVPMMHKWLRDLAIDGHQYDSYTAKVAALLRRNFVLSRLMFNLFSAGKVYAQMGPATDYVGANWIGKATVDYELNKSAWDATIDEKSLQMKNRYYYQERELAEMIQSEGANSLWQNKLARDFRNTGMAMHQWTDREVTRITWIGMYRRALAENEITGGDDSLAVAKADQAVRLTHPFGGTLYLPDAFRGAEWQKMITTFLNVQNKNFNLLRDSHREFKAGNLTPADMIGKFVGIGLLPAIWIAALSFRRPPTGKEIAEETLNQTMGSNLYLGFLTRAIVSNRDVSVTVPWSAPFQDIHNLMRRKDKIRYGLTTVDDILGLGTANLYRGVTGQMFRPIPAK